MANIQAITKPEFVKKSWKRHSDYLFSAKDSICRLGTAELPQASMNMPLAFISTDDEYSIAAVQGLQEETNFFVDVEGKWLGRYIPAAYRGYPFVLAKGESTKEEQVLCIDTDSGLLIDDNTEEPFFDGDLEPTQSVMELFSFLSSVDIAQQTSVRICKRLSEFGLLKPWELKFGPENNTTQVDGLLCIDEASLNELSGDAYAELRMIGAIPMIYCQLLSMQRISDLTLYAHEKSEEDRLLQSDELNFDGVNTDGDITFDNL